MVKIVKNMLKNKQLLKMSKKNILNIVLISKKFNVKIN